MKTSQRGIDMIKVFEALRLNAYPDSGGVWTIGYGTTVVNGIKVKMGDVCTKEQSETYLKSDLLRFEIAISKVLKVPVSQNQFDAMVSLWYNTGGSRTITELINTNTKKETIAMWWKSHYITAKGKVLNGLIMRREKEAELFIA